MLQRVRRRRWTIGPTSLLLFVVALGAPACTSGCGQHPTPPTEETPQPPGIDQPALPRCRVTEPPAPPAGRPTPDEVPAVAVAAGPHGVRTFQRTLWWDESATRRFELEPSAAVAFTGASYLVAAGRYLDAFDSELAQRTARRALPSRACGVQLVAPPGTNSGALMLYFRPARGACDDAAEGPAYVQRLSAAGVAIGPAVQLGRLGAEIRPSAARVSALRARLDAGRVVVITREREPPAEDEPRGGGEGDEPYPQQAPAIEHYTVLATDGRELASGVGATVACPRVGCVTFSGFTGGGATFGSQLGVSVLGRGSSFPVPLNVARVADVAASGDRVILRFAPGTSDEEAVPNRFALVDIVRRAVIPVFLEESREREDSWREPDLSPEGAQLLTAGGRFVIAGRASTRGGVVYKLVDCGS